MDEEATRGKLNRLLWNLRPSLREEIINDTIARLKRSEFKLIKGQRDEADNESSAGTVLRRAGLRLLNKE